MSSETDSEKIKEIKEFLRVVLSREQESLLWAGEIETIGLEGGYVREDEDDAGNHRIKAIVDSGRRVEGTVKFVDRQSEVSHRSAASSSFANLQQVVSSESSSPQDIACNTSESMKDRIAALHEWVVADNDSAACFVLTELAKDQPNYEWLTSLVFAAEDVRFPEQEQQQQAASRLRTIGLELRQRSDVTSEQAVFSAVRRFASLIPEEDANGLTEFLTNTGNIDTRLIALQCVSYIFEARPPRGADMVKSLRDRLFSLSNKFLDADVLVPGETSAIAEQVVCGLAATGDDRLDDCTTKVKNLGLSWFSDIVFRNLNSLRDTWLSENSDVQEHLAFQRVSQVLADWKPA